ncbi:hypothetical protein K2173_012033 [Erythroxylum novogranatense]|uniref:Uncharacterized protein n=1 Tax=Erythroxylum novogranatense TaxID=1862640 RepID=A0AAV8TEU4_9ROSI|nr:hypothetical protein K2173_012033 [Erythroxylum novogranatense]
MTSLSALKLKFLLRTATSSKLSHSHSWKQSLLLFQTSSRPSYSRIYSSSSSYSTAFGGRDKDGEKNSHDDDDEVIPTSGLCRPLSEILKELNKKAPDSLIRQCVEDGFSVRYVPWRLVNRIMNLHAPEWSGEVQNITYSPDNKSDSVVYHVTLYGTDAESGHVYHADCLENRTDLDDVHDPSCPLCLCPISPVDASREQE